MQARTPDGHSRGITPVQTSSQITNADSPYDVAQGEYVAVDATGGGTTVRFPTARAGGIMTVFVIAVGVNNVSIFPVAGETINGNISLLGLTALGPISFRAVRTAAGAYGWRQI